MSKSGFLCPKCKSSDTEYIWGSTTIECNKCGYQWDPGDDDDDDNCDYNCPQCGSNNIDIDDDGEFCCNECGLVGDVEDLEDYKDDSDYSSMTREQAMDEYNRTGINHSEHDLNDWDDINSRLGFDFYKPKK